MYLSVDFYYETFCCLPRSIEELIEETSGGRFSHSEGFIDQTEFD